MTYQLPKNAYPASLAELPEGALYMADLGDEDGLFFAGESCPVSGGTPAGPGLYRLPMNHETARRLWELLPWTAPRQVLGEARTIGTGDRLGIATLGHIRAVEPYDAYPVLAQQSMRELTLMGGTYETLLDRVTFQVLQAGYRRGYGADGDHLKTAGEVRVAIQSGVSMITLDCSEHIHCERDSAPLSPELEARYLAGEIRLKGAVLGFTRETLARAQAVYGEAAAFAAEVYRDCVAGHPVDFEVSMDETDAPTTPEEHYFAANELRLAGVDFRTLAPRFCGEFQKGIDYRGDLDQFRREIVVHAAIAEHFGYKLSVHSGSDKFSVFPAIGEATGERFHLKTSGTSWAEAVRVIAACNPELFRRMMKFSCEKFAEAKAYYHVSGQAEKVPPLDGIAGVDLPHLLDETDARQVAHITYGFLLQAAEEKPLFRDEIYDTLRRHKTALDAVITTHIRRHLECLGVFDA